MKLDAAAMTNDNATALLDAGLTAIRGGDTTIDLGSVRQVDSAAVALLLAWQREAQARGGRVRVANPPTGLTSLASLYGVDQLLGCPHHGTPPG